MNCTEFYRKIYEIIGDETPIGVDCGQLCDGACCKGDDETGMYLFPGEECLYKNETGWFEICESEFSYNSKNVKLFICKRACNREKRPLACRIFPLLPYVTKEGKLEIILDPRGRGLCPLAIMDLSYLDETFIQKVETIGKIMMKFRGTREYLKSLSRLADEFNIF